MRQGLIASRPRRLSFAALGLAALAATAATFAFQWNRKSVEGSQTDAHAASWLGDERTKRQAITQQTNTVVETIKNLKDLAVRGDAQSKQLAVIALHQIGEHLGH